MPVISVLRRLRQELLSQKKKKTLKNVTIAHIPKGQHVNNKVKYAQT